MPILAGAFQFVPNPTMASPFLPRMFPTFGFLLFKHKVWLINHLSIPAMRGSSIFHQACRGIKALTYGKKSDLSTKCILGTHVLSQFLFYILPSRQYAYDVKFVLCLGD
jgi:hypothetical protein